VTLRDEIHEQPEVAERLLREGRPAIERIAAAIRERDVEHVVIAARGTSDHAAIYAQYLFGVMHRLPVALAAPSIVSLYGVEPRFDHALVIGISQSGASPDVVGVVDAARRQGAPTIALTNEPGSPLAAAAEHVIDLAAGPERAVAATKTYTAELFAIALLSAAYGGSDAGGRGTADVPDAIRAALATEPDAAAAAADLAAMRACAVIGRGYDYATAREWALKLKELAHVVADPYSAADFRHGPVALVEPGFPILAIAPSGPAVEDLSALLRRLGGEHDADILVLSDRADVRALGRRSIALPDTLPDHLVPIVSIVPAQLFALHLTLARGLDTETPRHIAKVTRTS
jgi:glucosamine--fructose-6-phosphate aminotransferase (isomerizing)